MNFMLTPKSEIVENGKMDPEQLATAVKFAEELIALGVLFEQEEANVYNNFPLFLVPKPGQPGQWRCIADGKRGGSK